MPDSDPHAWLREEPGRRARAAARRRRALTQLALLALLAGGVAATALLAGTLQRVLLLGSLSQLVHSAYWTGLAIWAALLAMVLLVLVGVLSRWALIVPLGWLAAGAVLAHTGARTAAEIADNWAAEIAESPFDPPRPMRRGAPPFGLSAQTVLGFNGPVLQPRDDRRFYTVAPAPCAGVANEDARRLAPLVRSIERVERHAPNALCVTGGRPANGLYEVEQRSIEGGGSALNPVRGVETLVRSMRFNEPLVARFRQGEVDAPAPLLFVSNQCRYDLSASLTSCNWFALTRVAARTRSGPREYGTR